MDNQENQEQIEGADPVERRRRAGGMFERGATVMDVVRAVGVSYQAAAEWQRIWKQVGTEGLARGSRKGRRPKVREDVLRQVDDVLRSSPGRAGIQGETWTHFGVIEYIRRMTGVQYAFPTIQRLARQRGWHFGTTSGGVESGAGYAPTAGRAAGAESRGLESVEGSGARGGAEGRADALRAAFNAEEADRLRAQILAEAQRLVERLLDERLGGGARPR